MCVCPEHQRWLVIEGGQLMAIATVLRSSTTKAITASFDEQEVTQMPNYSAKYNNLSKGSSTTSCYYNLRTI